MEGLFYLWLKFYFPLSWVMVTNDNKFQTKKNKIWTTTCMHNLWINNTKDKRRGWVAIPSNCLYRGRDFMYFETMRNHYPFLYLNPEKRINSYWVEPSCTGHCLAYPPPLWVCTSGRRLPPYNNLLLCSVPHRYFINFSHKNDMPAKICVYLSYICSLGSVSMHYV